MKQPEHVLRRGFTLFIVGTFIACLLISLSFQPLGFLMWSFASILLVLTSRAYWRMTGKEIISPGMSLVLISFLFALVVVMLLRSRLEQRASMCYHCSEEAAWKPESACSRLCWSWNTWLVPRRGKSPTR